MLLPRRQQFPWKLRTRTLTLGERTQIMAIVNLTPDSFSGDGMAQRGVQATVDFALAALDEGADILDLGAESTRPNAAPLGADQEQRRLLPVVEGLLRARPYAVLSIDTYHAATARAAVEAGAEIVNDVSGLLWDPAMAATVAEMDCGLVLMHTRGRPQEWVGLPPLSADEVVPLVLRETQQRLTAALAAGVPAECIVLDPGFGFGKIGAENFALLVGLDRLAGLDRPLLAGLSRKRFLGEAVAAAGSDALPPAQARLHATSAAHVAAVLAGAHLLRVHDVRAAREAAAVADALRAAECSPARHDMP